MEWKEEVKETSLEGSLKNLDYSQASGQLVNKTTVKKHCSAPNISQSFTSYDMDGHPYNGFEHICIIPESAISNLHPSSPLRKKLDEYKLTR